MADMTIDDATPDSSVTGVEKFPASDGGAAKSVTVAQIKDFVLAKIAELTGAGAFSVNDDSVFILRGGSLMPVDADVLAAALFNEAFGRAGVAEPNGNEVIAVKDSTARKTLTLAQIKTWLQSNMTVTPDLTLSSASVAGTLGDSDLALVVQAAAGKKVTLATLKDYVLGKLAAYMAATTAAQSVSGTDIVLIAQGGVLRKATVSQLLGNASGGVTGPNTTTENKIPQWDSTTKKLKDGLTVTSSISSSSTATQIPTAAAVHSAIDAKGDVKKSGTPAAGSLAKWDANGKVEGGPSVVNSTAGIANAENASDEKVPTEKAVRDAIEGAAGVGAPETPVQGNIPTWGEGSALTGGMAVVTEIGTYPNVSDEKIPTEKAVRDVLENAVMKPSSHVENCIPTWGSGTELKAGLAVVPSTTGIASADNASDEKIPTEKAVRAVLPVAATTSTSGLMTAADKMKLNNLVDQTAVQEVGDDSPLGDSDVLTVLKGGMTWKKSLLHRFWTYIMDKLTTFKIDDLAAGDDNTDLDASTSKHGLCPKFPNDATKFLRGDGTFAEPAGTTDFTGDGGSGGTHGLVPAPGSGDAAANKFLNASGEWAVPPSAAGVDIPGATAIDAVSATDVLYCYDASENAYRKVTLAQVLALSAETKKYETLFVSAGAMIPGATSPATAGAITFTDVKHDTMAFGSTADQTAEFDVVMPDGWDKSSVKVKALWTYYNSTLGQAGQHVKFLVGAISCPDGGDVSDAPSTTVAVTDQAQSANELCRTAASAALTPNGTNGDGNLLHFTVTRDADYAPDGGDALPTDALLLGVLIQYGKTEVLTAW